MDVWLPGKSPFSEQLSRIGADAKAIEVKPRRNLYDSGVYAVIGVTVDTALTIGWNLLGIADTEQVRRYHLPK